MKDFKKDLNQRFWQYQETKFPQWQTYFEQGNVGSSRPPVFLSHEAWRNIIVNPDANQEEIEKLHSLMPESEHHRWFHSMNSSQALALSILGNLLIHNSLDILEEVQDDQRKAIFGKVKITPDNFVLEKKVDYLGEPRPTSLDGYISGDYRIAIECKFTENEFGSCSRPRLTPKDSNYSRDYCNGTYSKQESRKTRCSLSEIGVRYWDYVPKLFKWESDRDLVPCPLYKNYQLMRNILAVGVDSNKQVSSENGHAVLIYDERNPAFQEGGHGYWEYLASKEALHNPVMLNKCSWQSITQLIRKKCIIPWLSEELNLKYGF